MSTRKRLRAVEECTSALGYRIDDLEEHAGNIIGPSWNTSLERRMQDGLFQAPLL